MANIPIYNQQVAPPHKPRQPGGISVAGAEARAMAQFGQQLEDTGRAFAGTLFDLATRNELNQANVTAQERWLEFRRSLEQDPDYGSYEEKLTEFARNVRDEIGLSLKFPRAKREIASHLQELLVDWKANVGELADQRAIEHARTLGIQAVDQLVQNRDLEGLLTVLDDLRANGVFFDADLAKIKDTAVMEMLQGQAMDTAVEMGADGVTWLLSDGAEAMSTTELPDGQTYRLDRDARGALAKKLQSQIDFAAKQDQEAAWQEFVELTKDVTEMDQLSRTELTSYLLRVSPQDRGAVQRVIDHYDKTFEQQAQDDLELAQDVDYSRLSQEIHDWDGTGKQPWTLADLTHMVADKTLTREQRNALEQDLKTAKEELIKGERTPGQMQQNKVTSAIRGRMYTALDNLTDPTTVVSVAEIEETLNTGAITAAQHDQLLALRETMRDKYESRLEAAKKAEGPELEDPAKEAELWAIVMDDKLTSTEKWSRARSYLGNGVPGNKYAQITGHINDIRDDWNLVLKDLNAFYNASIMAIDKSDDQRKAMALEKAAAGRAMMEIFRTYPDAPDKWDAAVQSLLNPSAKKELTRMMQSKLGARFRWFGTSEAMQLETLREQMPREFTGAPGLVAQRSIQEPQIIKEETATINSVLASQGRKDQIVDYYRLASGDFVYATVPIPRDENGVPSREDLKKLRAAGQLFTVQSVAQGRRIEQVVK